MNARLGILILAVVGLAGMPGASWSAQPVAGKDYYSVQLLSGKSAAALQNSLAQLAGQPYARIDQRGGVYILRVGFWESREEAVQAAQALLPNFRNAYARVASYRPDAIVAGAGQPTPGAAAAPSAASAAVPPRRTVESAVEQPPRTAAAPPPTTAPPPAVTESTRSQAQVLGLRRDAQANLLPDPELLGINPVPPPTEQPRAAVSPPSDVAPTPRERPRASAQPRPARGPNEVPLWDLLRKERYAELDAEVSRLREAYPQWSPPARLLDLKKEAVARRQITEAVNTKEWNNVVALAQQYPEQFACNQIHFLWGLAEAHHGLGQTAQTIAVYERIIPACPKSADRITTLQKAKVFLTPEIFEELSQREARGGRRDSAQQTQLDQLTRAPTPNEVPLWDLLRLERYAELDAELARVRAAYPRWRPPARLLTLKREGAARLQITEAVDTKDWTSVEALARQYPEQFTCNQVHFLWGLAEAHHARGQTEQTIAVYERIIPACPKAADRITTLQKAGNTLTPEVFAELLQREARGGKRDAAQQSQLDQMTYEFQLRQLLQAIQLKDRPRAIALIGTIDRMPKAQRDSRYASSAGWFYLDAGEDESAITWFETALNWQPANEDSEDARHGVALAKFRLSRRDGAGATKLSVKSLDEAEAALSRASPEDERNRALLGEILFARAVDAFNGKEFGQSLAYLEQSEAYGRSGRDVAMMHAWIYYQRGEDRKAADSFIDLYRAQPDKESAEGAVLSLSRSERWAELAQLSRSLGGPMKEQAGLPFADRHYYRKLFVATEAAAPGDFAELDNIATPSLTIGIMLRDKAGSEGTSRLTMLKLPAMDGTVVLGGTHELRLQVDRMDLASGDLPAGAAIGSFPVAGGYVAVPTTRLINSFEPYLSYQHQGTLTAYAGIGMTPTRAPVASKPVGNIGFTQQAGRGNWGAEFFAQPVRESMLSYTGIVDPYTGQSWGRVRRTGGLIRGYTAITERVGVSGRLRAMNLRGENVANNRSVGLSLSLARNLTVPGFDFLAVGPDLSIDKFDKNLSGFTIGNGGYFSPERLISFGVSANFLTAEARQFSVKGNFSVGYFDKRETVGTCFPLGGMPLNPACPNSPASHDNGVYYSAQLLGMWRYADHLQLGGGFVYGSNPQYNDKSAVVFLRYLFYPRPAVMSSDLPDAMLQRMY